MPVCLAHGAPQMAAPPKPSNEDHPFLAGRDPFGCIISRIQSQFHPPSRTQPVSVYSCNADWSPGPVTGESGRVSRLVYRGLAFRSDPAQEETDIAAIIVIDSAD